MSELQGQMTLDLSAARGAVDERYYDENGDLLPEPRNVNAEVRLGILAGEINLLEMQARETFKATAVQIGTRLIEAQGLVPKGRWGEWLEKNIAYSTRKAQQLMQVAEAYAGKALPESYDKLSFTQIYDLLSAPAEARDALAEEAAEERLSTRQLKERIKALEEDRQKDNRKIYDLIQEAEEKDRVIEQQKKDIEDERERAVSAQVEAQRLGMDARNAVDRANTADAALREARAQVDRMTESAKTFENHLDASNAKNRKLEQMLQEAREQIEALQASENAVVESVETVEVVPEAVTAELEDLRRQLQEAQSRPDDKKARAVLALNIQARLGMLEIREKVSKVKKAIDDLGELDVAQAEARRGELLDITELIEEVRV